LYRAVGRKASSPQQLLDIRDSHRFLRSFLGRPSGSGRTRRPRNFSTLLKKLSLPSERARPVCVPSCDIHDIQDNHRFLRLLCAAKAGTANGVAVPVFAAAGRARLPQCGVSADTKPISALVRFSDRASALVTPAAGFSPAPAPQLQGTR